MHTYLVILKEDVILNKKVLRYFANNDFVIEDYYPNLRIIKISSEVFLEEKKLKYISSIEEEKTMSL